MKQTFQEALAASKQKCEQDLQKAEDKAQALYTRLSDKALSQHDQRVEKIIRKEQKLSPAARAFAENNDMLAIRKAVSEKIRHLHYQTGHEFRALWTEAYARLFEQTGFNPKSKTREPGEVVLDVVCNVGLLGQLMEAIDGMLNDSRLFEGRSEVPARPVQAELPLGQPA